MATSKRNSLAIIHAALTDPVASGVLAALSADDMDALAERAHSRSLAPDLQPLIVHDSINDAIAAMPEPVGAAVRKLPSDVVERVKRSLSELAPTDGGPVKCTCR